MKKLLVPIDFSEESIIAMENAIKLANKIRLNVQMIHIKKRKTLAVLFGGSESDHLPDEMYFTYFNKIIERVKDSYTVVGGKIDFVLFQGHIVEEIVHYSYESDVYAIFTGLQGTSSYKSFIIGSNAFRIIATTKTPVFVVRKEMGVREINKILLPLEVTHDSRQKIPLVAGLAKEMNVPVKVVGLSDTSNYMANTKLKLYTQQAFDYLNQLGISSEMEIKTQINIANVLLETAEREHFDLIAMMTDVSEDPIGITLGNTVRYVINHAKTPLLLIPPTKRFSTNH